MKEKILEILTNNINVPRYKNAPHYPTAIDGLPQSAEEITAMVMEFVEWAKDNMEIIFNPSFGQYFWASINPVIEYSTEELFNYWLINIYKK